MSMPVFRYIWKYIIFRCVITYNWCRHNSSLPRQNGHHLADDIFKYIFMNEKVCILIRNSLKLVPNSQIDNESVLVQVKAWRPIADKPLSEPMLTQSTDAFMRHYEEMGN